MPENFSRHSGGSREALGNVREPSPPPTAPESVRESKTSERAGTSESFQKSVEQPRATKSFRQREGIYKSAQNTQAVLLGTEE